MSSPLLTMAEKHTIIRAEVGSTVYGLNLDNNGDRDELGICIEDFSEAMGTHEPFEQVVYRSASGREGRNDARSQKGDLDLTIYSLRKKDLLLASPLPAEPNREAVERWMLDMYWQSWRSRYGSPSHWLYAGLTPEKNKEWLEATRETTG